MRFFAGIAFLLVGLSICRSMPIPLHEVTASAEEFHPATSNVEYNNSPFQSINKSSTRRLTNTREPIRITVHYDGNITLEINRREREQKREEKRQKTEERREKTEDRREKTKETS